MKRALISFLFLMAIVSAGAAQSYDFIKDQNWLLARLGDPNVVVLHVGGAENYEEGHIQGAQLILPEAYRIHTETLRWEVPDLAELNNSLSSKGITNKTINILYYGEDNFALAYRLYFTLDYLGLGAQTFILDGGLKGWKKSDLPVTTAPSQVSPTPEGQLKLKPKKKQMADKELVLKSLSDDRWSIIDARKPEFYLGETDGDGYYQRSGHIANARNITWLDLVDENQYLLPYPELEAQFRAAGVKEGDQVITYCHVGLRATVLYTLAKSMGHKVKLYDGSYNEWDKLPDTYPVQQKE